MRTHTVTVTAPGVLAGDFEQMLDALPCPVLIGSEQSVTVTLQFDVRATSARRAVEVAFARIQHVLREQTCTFEVARSSKIEGRRPWWRWRMAGRRFP